MVGQISPRDAYLALAALSEQALKLGRTNASVHERIELHQK